jgi:hypothetical protein
MTGAPSMNQTDATSPSLEQLTNQDLKAMIDDIEVALQEAQKEVASGSLSPQNKAEAGQEISDWENDLARMRAELAKRSLGQAMP